MQFPDASGVPVNMLYPQDGTAFDMLARLIDVRIRRPERYGNARHGRDPRDRERQPFGPDAKSQAMLDEAARTASRMAHIFSYEPSPLITNAGFLQGS